MTECESVCKIMISGEHSKDRKEAISERSSLIGAAKWDCQGINSLILNIGQLYDKWANVCLPLSGKPGLEHRDSWTAVQY